MKYKVIGFGEVLWDLLPEGARIGGAPLNVCYHLNKANVESFIISQIGQDKLGAELLTEVKDLGVNTVYIAKSNNYSTSTVEVSLDEKGSPSYTIVEDVAWDYIAYDPTVATEIGKADAFVFGSLVARNQKSYDTLLKYVACAKYAVMDINLRAPFFTKERIFNLLQHVDLLKINDEEIVVLAEWLGIEMTEEQTLCQYLMVTFPKLKEILLTKGAKGSVYFTADIRESIGVYDVKVDDTIGAGDSFLAAFLAKRLIGASVHEALDEAALVSAFVASKSGANPTYSDVDLENFKSYTTLKKPL